MIKEIKYYNNNHQKYIGYIYIGRIKIIKIRRKKKGYILM